MTPAQIIAAEVAARYGIAVCPSVVQVCPPMTCTATTPIWNEKIRQLVYPDNLARKVLHKKAIWAGAVRARAAAINPVIAARRDSVLTLHGEGQSVPAIMAALQIKYHIVMQDFGKLGLKPNAYATDMMTQAKVRADRIKQLHGAGWDVKCIAVLMGISEDTVRDLAFKHHGLRFARKAAQPRVKVVKPPKVLAVKQARAAKPVIESVSESLVLARQRAIRAVELINQGLTQRAVAKLLGVTPRQVRRDCRNAGVDVLRPGRWREKQAVAA
jgi:hypothetical protein